MAMKNVNAAVLKEWLVRGEAVVVDVREPAEHEAEKIAGATLLPLAQISGHRLPDLSGKKLVVHCRAGLRGANACKKLLEENPDLEIYNLDGGIVAWQAAGHAIDAS